MPRLILLYAQQMLRKASEIYVDEDVCCSADAYDKAVETIAVRKRLNVWEAAEGLFLCGLFLHTSYTTSLLISARCNCSEMKEIFQPSSEAENDGRD